MMAFMFTRPLSPWVPGLMLTVGLLASSQPAQAALAVGSTAPDFSTQAATAGKAQAFKLSSELSRGPVVLYFYPKAFTSGCTVEAHLFAEATERFRADGATVVGISTDDIETLKKFSVEACRNKFAVAADGNGKITKQYDAGFALLPGVSDRISYVISPDGKIVYSYSSMNPEGHVENTLKALKQWRQAQK
jgi:peroxiredoxin Q/BCP